MAATKIISYSELDTYRQCRLKHQLAYKELWGFPEGKEPEALARGTLFHSVMEAHYAAKKVWDSLPAGETVPETAIRDEAGMFFEAVKPLLFDEVTGGQTDRQELVEYIYRGYVDQWQADQDWKVVGIEVPLEAWLPTARGTRSSFKLAGTIDLVVRDRSMGGGLWIVDHKTCKRLPKGKDLDLEDQTGLYTFLMRQNGIPIRGAIYNFCRTEVLQRPMTLTERFARPVTVRTDRELENIGLEALELAREAYAARRGGPTSERGTVVDAPRTPDGERCGWKCGFTEACLVGRKGGRMRPFLRDTGFVQNEHKPGPTFQKRAAEGKQAR